MLLAAGVTDEEIRQRLARGALIRVYPGVYRVGHQAPSVKASYLAAVWACGHRAVLVDLAAAHLHALLRRAQHAPRPVVSAPAKRHIRGVTTRRRTLARDEITSREGIPVTTVERTLLDLAATLDEDDLARAVHEAHVQHRVRAPSVIAVLERHPRAAGRQKLYRVLTGETRVTLSGMEKRFLEMLKDAGLPLPETNRPAGAHRVDCRWPDHHLTIELDSYTFHNTRHSWEQDRQREREAHARGDTHRRLSLTAVFAEPQQTIDEVSDLLEASP